MQNTLKILLCFAALIIGQLANAEQFVEVVEKSGLVQARDNATGSSPWRAVEVGDRLAIPVEIETGDSGTVKLRSGTDVFELKSKTRIAVPEGARSDTGLSRVMQWFGTTWYKITRGPDEFSVDTPHLVAVVKGTQFSIVIEDDSSVVSLIEGRLAVSLLNDRDEFEMMLTGDVASASVIEGLQVFGSEDTTSSLPQTSDMPAAAAVVNSNSQSKPGNSSSNAAPNANENEPGPPMTPPGLESHPKSDSLPRPNTQPRGNPQPGGPNPQPGPSTPPDTGTLPNGNPFPGSVDNNGRGNNK